MAWPAPEWAEARLPRAADQQALDAIVARVLEDGGMTRALVVARRGMLIAEGYAADQHPAARMRSYSMAKSVVSAAVGLLVDDGRLHLDAPADVPAWRGPGDPRAAVRLSHLLHMSSGIASNEDHLDANSDTLAMLFGSGRHDVARHAAEHPLAYEPGRHFAYSNSTTNLLSGIVARAVGGGEAGYRRFLDERLFGPLAMTSATPGFDRAGTFVGSTFLWATARDYARFGCLYLANGRWNDAQILSRAWIDWTRTPAPASGGRYGAHVWLGPQSDDAAVAAAWPAGVFCARGLGGQVICICPALETVVVMLGAHPLLGEPAWLHRERQLAEVFTCLARAADLQESVR